MTDLYIEKAAAIGPLGGSLDEIWEKILRGQTHYNKASLPGQRTFFASESYLGTSSDILDYAPLYHSVIQHLVSDLKLVEPVDAIFFATAVGNLADAEKKIYSNSPLGIDVLDFAETKTVFFDTKAYGSKTRFISVPTGCCAGLQAVGLAKKIMPKLGLKTAVIMSLDFALTPLAFEAFRKINATKPYDPNVSSSPSRPFCDDRNGFLFADGGGAVLVTTEKTEDTKPRISGYGCVSSAFHMTDIATDGHAIRDSIKLAMKQANINESSIGHVNLHASGTRQNDEAEHAALQDIFTGQMPDITAFKGNHGHALSGANMIEIALSWKMLNEGVIPPTPDQLPVNAFPQISKRCSEKALVKKSILKTASGFSGIHAALIMEY